MILYEVLDGSLHIINNGILECVVAASPTTLFPGGTEHGTKTLRKRFGQISNVTLQDSPDKAQYIVTSAIDWYDTATKTVPAIKYDLFLKSKEGRVIGEWSEIIHQADGDRSWW